jgi:hypothetical protein
MSKPSTLQDILLRAVEKPLARNNRTSVYELPADAFEGSDNYLLRARFSVRGIDELSRKRVLDKALKTTTSLTPVTLGCGYHFSQPLLGAAPVEELRSPTSTLKDSVTMELVHKAHGTSLMHLQGELSRDAYENKLAELPDETYKTFLQEVLWLTDHGVSIEAGKGDHIYLEERSMPPTLTLIDVLEDQGKSHQDKKANILAYNCLGEMHFYRTADSATQDRLYFIAKKIGFPVSRADVIERIRSIPPEYTVVKPIVGETGEPMSMNTPSWKVKLKLEAIERHNASLNR